MSLHHGAQTGKESFCGNPSRFFGDTIIDSTSIDDPVPSAKKRPSVVSVDETKFASKKSSLWVKKGGQPADVLLGDYECAKHHPGNIEFGKLISNSFLESEYQYAFESPERWKNEIVLNICSRKGRFFMPEDPTAKPSEISWLPISDKDAQKVIAGYSIVLTQMPTKDILHGQSPRLRNNEGNEWLRKICKKNYEAYNTSSRLEKTQCSGEIIKIAHEQKRRFLKEVFTESELWTEIDKKKAREKVASMFRGMRKPKKRKKKRATDKGEDDPTDRFDQEVSYSSCWENLISEVDGNPDLRLHNLGSREGEYAIASNDDDWKKIEEDWLKKLLNEVDFEDPLWGKALSSVFDQEEEKQLDKNDDGKDDDNGDDDDGASTDDEEQNDADGDEKDECKKDRDNHGDGGGNSGSHEHDGEGKSNNGHGKEDDSRRNNSNEYSGNDERNGSDKNRGTNEKKNDSRDNGEYSNASDNERDSNNSIHDSDDDHDDESINYDEYDDDSDSEDDDDDGMSADLRMKQLVVAKFDSYRNADPDQKQEISHGVLETLRNEGWLYLRRPRKASWLSIGTFEARIIVAHTFRALERLERLKNFKTNWKKAIRTYTKLKSSVITPTSNPGYSFEIHQVLDETKPYWAIQVTLTVPLTALGVELNPPPYPSRGADIIKVRNPNLVGWIQQGNVLVAVNNIPLRVIATKEEFRANVSSKLQTQEPTILMFRSPTKPPSSYFPPPRLHAGPFIQKLPNDDAYGIDDKAPPQGDDWITKDDSGNRTLARGEDDEIDSSNKDATMVQIPSGHGANDCNGNRSRSSKRKCSIEDLFLQYQKRMKKEDIDNKLISTIPTAQSKKGLSKGRHKIKSVSTMNKHQDLYSDTNSELYGVLNQSSILEDMNESDDIDFDFVGDVIPMCNSQEKDKNPNDKPMRPLSAYNMFSQNQRERIVAGETGDPTPFEIQESINKIFLSPKRRQECISNGQFSFRTIAAKWEAIDPKLKAIYNHYAAQEKVRYQKESLIWKEKKDREHDDNMYNDLTSARSETINVFDACIDDDAGNELLAKLFEPRRQELDDASMAVYKSKASVDVERYKKELGEWDARHGIALSQKTNKDVLLGQSPKLRKHGGNKLLRELVVSSYDRYYDSQTTKMAKFAIAEEVIHLIKRSGGRFLKFRNDHWVEIDDYEARKKLAATFRGLRKKREGKKRKRNSGSRSPMGAESPIWSETIEGKITEGVSSGCHSFSSACSKVNEGQRKAEFFEALDVDISYFDHQWCPTFQERLKYDAYETDASDCSLSAIEIDDTPLNPNDIPLATVIHSKAVEESVVKLASPEAVPEVDNGVTAPVETDAEQQERKLNIQKIDLTEKFEVPRFPKSDGVVQFIDNSLVKNFIFASLSGKERRLLIDAMVLDTVPAKTVIIKQGEAGDFFSVVDEGHISFAVDGKLEGACGRGGSFGELALLYNRPRAATCLANTTCRLWKVDQRTFRYILGNHIPFLSEFVKKSLIHEKKTENSCANSFTPGGKKLHDIWMKNRQLEDSINKLKKELSRKKDGKGMRTATATAADDDNDKLRRTGLVEVLGENESVTSSIVSQSSDDIGFAFSGANRMWDGQKKKDGYGQLEVLGENESVTSSIVSDDS